MWGYLVFLSCKAPRNRRNNIYDVWTVLTIKPVSIPVKILQSSISTFLLYCQTKVEAFDRTETDLLCLSDLSGCTLTSFQAPEDTRITPYAGCSIRNLIFFEGFFYIFFTNNMFFFLQCIMIQQSQGKDFFKKQDGTQTFSQMPETTLTAALQSDCFTWRNI